MKPENTAHMSRQDVKAFIVAEMEGGIMDLSDLHDKNKIAYWMKTLGKFQNDRLGPLPDYDRVMGALLHFWKQSP